MFSAFLADNPLLEPASDITFSSLTGSARPMLIANICSQYDVPCMVICANDNSAAKTADALRFFSPELQDRIIQVAGAEILPYDLEDPHPRLQSNRIRAFHDIFVVEKPIVVCSIQTILQRVPEGKFWTDNKLEISVRQKIETDQVVSALEQLTYSFEPVSVFQPGQYSRRGNIIDIYPTGDANAYRLRINNGAVHSIQPISLKTQRSLDEVVPSIQCLFARAYPTDQEAIDRLRKRYRTRFQPNISQPFYRDLCAGLAPSGCMQYLPLMMETVSLLDYLSGGACFLVDDPEWKETAAYWEGVNDRYADMVHDSSRDVLTPEEAWISPLELQEKLQNFALVRLTESEGVNSLHTSATGFSRQASTRETIAMLSPAITEARKVLFTLSKPVRRDQVGVLAQFCGLFPEDMETWEEFFTSDEECGIVIAPLEEGFFNHHDQILVITEKEIFGRLLDSTEADADARRIDFESINDFSSIQQGDPIVHEQNGIGRFAGIEKIKAGGVTREYLAIEYKEGARTMVTMQDLGMVNRYSGVNPEKAPLQAFNDPRWTKSVREAQEDILKTARGIVRISKGRRRRLTGPFEGPDATFRRFVLEFPFKETADQKVAVDEIIADMMSNRPMDRVICGDVGFGKTEVAMRAAFLAVKNERQVSIMVPTSLLAQQHFESFSERMADFGVNVACINNCKSKREEQLMLADLVAGEIDVMIGTHRLLSADVEFHDLGLLVIDEEHRFGVEDKETLNGMRASLDTISMSATPIPRTLGMSLSGLRDFSIIATPPARRLAIRTQAADYSDALVKEAIQREMLRNGQAFYLYNNTKEIARRAEEIAELIPGIRVGVVHGKMSESNIESVMRQFYRREIDVLACTTIVEIGIDVPNANTILIDHADRFGIAQLHQLRGRVGRSDRQAYAYLLKRSKLSATAEKRLHALESATQLGDGFALAYHDMEVRGAGEILGEGQSGNIQEVGYSLYMKMLQKAIRILQNNRPASSIFDDTQDPYVDLHISGYIPEDYIQDKTSRLSIYKRLMSELDPDNIKELVAELEDRYGEIPGETKNLALVARLKCTLNDLDLKSLVIGENGGVVSLRRHGIIDNDTLEVVASNHPGFSNPSEGKLVVDKAPADISARIDFILDLLDEISEVHQDLTEQT